MTWCTYLQSLEKRQQCVFELVRKLNVTDRQTRQTDGRTGGVAISPVPGPTAPAGDKNVGNRSSIKKHEENIK